MRSHRRRNPAQHVLIAGNADDLDAMAAELAVLSADVYGQVFVEAPADLELHLVTPPRVTVHRLSPEPHSLCAALAGWAAEWVPDEQDPERTVSVWIGRHVRASVDVGLQRPLES